MYQLFKTLLEKKITSSPAKKITLMATILCKE